MSVGGSATGINGALSPVEIVMLHRYAEPTAGASVQRPRRPGEICTGVIPGQALRDLGPEPDS